MTKVVIKNSYFSLWREYIIYLKNSENKEKNKEK